MSKPEKSRKNTQNIRKIKISIKKTVEKEEARQTQVYVCSTKEGMVMEEGMG